MVAPLEKFQTRTFIESVGLEIKVLDAVRSSLIVVRSVMYLSTEGEIKLSQINTPF